MAGVEAVLDGEIVCVDEQGRSQFDALMHRRAEPCFVAFDVLWHGGMDVRPLPLWKRKQILRALIPKRSGALLYADSVARRGTALYHIACDQDPGGHRRQVAAWPVLGGAAGIVAEDQEPDLQPGGGPAGAV